MLLIAGSLAMLIAVFMTSLCKEYYQFFLAQALLLGASMSFLFCPAIAAVSRYFHKNKGLAMGITVGGSSLGGVIWPIAINELLNKDGVSFGWTLRAVGFIMLPLLAIAVLTVSMPKAQNEQTGHDNQHQEPRESEQRDKIAPLKHIVKNTTFLLLCGGLAICYLGMFSPFFYVTSYAESLGHSTNFSFYLISIVNAASLFGRILPGFLADRYGHFNLCGLAALFSGIIAFCWTPVKSTAGLAIWSLAYGFSSGVRYKIPLGARIANCLGNHELAISLRSPGSHARYTRYGGWTFDGILFLDVGLDIVPSAGLTMYRALFGTPISGQLVGSYGYLALSMYTGATLVSGSLLIIFAGLKLNKARPK